MTDDYNVGYKKPPKHTRFQKGKSGNPGGRPPKKREVVADDIKALLNDQIAVTQNGKQTSKHPKEVELQSLLKRVIEKRDLSAAEYLLTEFEKYGCMPSAEEVQQSAVLRLPDTEDMPFEKSLLIMQQYGTFDLTPDQVLDMEQKWEKKQQELEETERQIMRCVLGISDYDE